MLPSTNMTTLYNGPKSSYDPRFVRQSKHGYTIRFDDELLKDEMTSEQPFLYGASPKNTFYDFDPRAVSRPKAKQYNAHPE
jgi:hypothetical protein